MLTVVRFEAHVANLFDLLHQNLERFYVFPFAIGAARDDFEAMTPRAALNALFAGAPIEMPFDSAVSPETAIQGFVALDGFRNVLSHAFWACCLLGQTCLTHGMTLQIQLNALKASLQSLAEHAQTVCCRDEVKLRL